MKSSSSPWGNPKQPQRNYRMNGGSTSSGTRLEGGPDDGRGTSVVDAPAHRSIGPPPGNPPQLPTIQFGTLSLDTVVLSNASLAAVSGHAQFSQPPTANQAQVSTNQRVTQGWDQEQPCNLDFSQTGVPPPIIEAKRPNLPRAVSQERESGLEGSVRQKKSSLPASECLPVDENEFPPLGGPNSLAPKGKTSGKGGAWGFVEQVHIAGAHQAPASKRQELGQQSEAKSAPLAGDGRDKAGQTYGRKGGDGSRSVEQRGGWQGMQRRDLGQGGELRNYIPKGHEARDELQDGLWRESTWEKQNSIDSLGRMLSGILRHQAPGLNLKMRRDGYVEVQALLKLSMQTRSNRPLSSHNIDDIRQVVKQDNKQRFGMKEEDGKLLIRANQGHTIKSVKSEELLKPIVSADGIPVCVHGTYRKNLDRIYKEGLKRMKRNHVHFAKGIVGNKDGVSGIRSTSEILIYLNVKKALADGMKLYISENGVILTEGFNGVVPPDYFEKVLQLRGMKPITP